MNPRGTKLSDKALEALNNEERYVQSTYKQARRVKIERGKLWRVRFLPAKMGDSETWYARIAKHWNGKSGIVCPVHTHPDYGGDPDAYCPACETAKTYNDSRVKEESDYGYKVSSVAQWLTYCCVFEKDDDVMGMNEVLIPYEFNHYRSSWESLRTFYKSNASRSADSILDYLTGNDFVVSKTAKGMQLDKQDAAPIFDDADPKFEEWIAKVEEGLKTPKISVPTEEALNIFAQKIEESAPRIAAPRHVSRRGAAPVDYEEDSAEPEPEHDHEEVDVPRRGKPVAAAARPTARPAATRPVRQPDPEPEQEEAEQPPARPVSRATARPVAKPAAVEEPELEDAEPAPERPAVRAATAARAPLPVPPSHRQPAPAKSNVPIGPDDDDDEPEPEKPAAPVSSDENDEPQEPPARSARTVTRAAVVPAAKVPARRAAPVAETTEEDELPEEANDPAPPQAPEEDAPAPIAAKGQSITNIRSRLNAVRQQTAQA